MLRGLRSRQEIVEEVGIVEARRLGYVDKWDQLLYATRALSEEIKCCGGPQASILGTYDYSTCLGFLRHTLKEFQYDA